MDIKVAEVDVELDADMVEEKLEEEEEAEEGRGRRGRRRRRMRRTALIKSNNPHLAGGEIKIIGPDNPTC